MGEYSEKEETCSLVCATSREELLAQSFKGVGNAKKSCNFALVFPKLKISETIVDSFKKSGEAGRKLAKTVTDFCRTGNAYRVGRNTTRYHEHADRYGEKHCAERRAKFDKNRQYYNSMTVPDKTSPTGLVDTKIAVEEKFNNLYCRGTKGEYSASRLHWLPHALVRGICSTRAMNKKQNP